MATTESAQTKVSLKGKTILVVEDEQTVRTLLTKLLEKNDATAPSAVDGLAALEWLQNHTPDLILCDVMMPHLDGFALARALKFLSEKHGWRPTPIIFLTAKTDARAMIEGINVGAKFFLTKPFVIGNVLAKIARALGERSERGQKT
ncbi:MAG: response regulator [Patescibacteria group bacterium]